MLIDDEVTYELDIDIPINGTDVVLKSGKKFITKGEVLPLTDIFKASLFQANRQNMLKYLEIEQNIKEQDLADFYGACIEKATPFIYYFMELDKEEKEKFFYLCMYDSYHSLGSVGGDLCGLMINRTDGLGIQTYDSVAYYDKIKEMSEINRWKKMMVSMSINKSLNLGPNSGFAAILSLLDGQNGFFNNFKVLEKEDFTQGKQTQLEALNAYTDFRPFMWDVFFVKLSVLEKLGHEMGSLVETALEDLILKAENDEKVCDIVVESNFYNIYKHSKMVNKDKVVIEFINQNIDTPFFEKKAQLAYKMLDVLWKNKVEIVKNFPTNIFTKNLIMEDPENSKKIYFNVDAYLNLVKCYFSLSSKVGENNIFKDWEGSDFEGKYVSVPLLKKYADLKNKVTASKGVVGDIISKKEIDEWLHMNENEKDYSRAIGKEISSNMTFQGLIANVLKTNGQKVKFKNTSKHKEGEIGFFNVWECEIEDVSFKESFVKILKAIPFHEESSLVKVTEVILDEYLMKKSVELKESTKSIKRLKF